MYFKGKKVWITGASSGIGEAMSRAIATQGATLILSGRRLAKLEELAQELAAEGAQEVHCLAFDLAVQEQREVAIAKFKKQWSFPDVMILNGGLSQRSLIAETQFEVYRTLIEVDYLANVQLSKAFLEEWRSSQSGQVVVISSLVGKFGTPFRSGYAAAKHALHGFFDTLRAEAHRDKLKVNIICPGFVHTQVSVNALRGDGNSLGEMDRAQAKGLSPEAFARKALQAIEGNKAESYIGKKEKLGVYIKRFFPVLFRRMITKAQVR